MMKTVWAKNLLKEYNARLAFQLKCERADRLEVIALDFYQVFVNGEFLGFGPAKTAYGYARKDVYDLSAYENFVITVEVLCHNIPSYSFASGKPLFGAELYKGSAVVADTDNFQAFAVTDYLRKVQKYSFQRGFSENYEMQADRSAFYLGESVFPRIDVVSVEPPVILDRGVPYPFYRRTDGEKVEAGSFTVDPNAEHWYESWQMENNPKLNACFEREEIAEFVSDTVSEFVFKKDGIEAQTLAEKQFQTYDFRRIVVGFFALELEVLQDCELYLEWAEIARLKEGVLAIDFWRNDCCDIIKYKLKKGKYSLLSFEPYCLKVARLICMTGQVRIDDFYIKSFENTNLERVAFECENENLEKIVRSSVNTLAHNAVDIYTDCPGRERAGWLCDGYFMGEAEQLLFQCNDVERNFLENYVLANNLRQYPKGMIPMCYPSNVLSGKFIPNWALWFILELKRYYERTGDKQLIMRAKEKVYGIVDYFKPFENEYGLLENLTSWVFVEWSKANDFTDGVNFPTNMLYLSALKAASELYGDGELLQKSKSGENAIIALSFNGSFFADNALRNESGGLCRTDNTSETCQYYALFFGLADGERFKEFRALMEEKFGHGRDDAKIYPTVYKSNCFIGNYLRLAYLLRAKRYTKVLKECEEYFSEMAKTTGTLWEHDEEAHSLDHGFASYAACLIIESLQMSNTYRYDFTVRKKGERECTY
ncbi:MAG: hypothetical protein IJX98_02135 [Clostridia bacterium]|nr:hypothetical protein [Clostridia bacterium]